MVKTDTVALSEIGQQLDHLTRRERGRLIAGLVHRLGGRYLQLAEDVAQEALIKALTTWPYRGIPDNPAAWLTRVAHNAALDRLRRENRELPYDPDLDRRAEATQELDEKVISDPELHLVFLSCHPTLAGIDQLALTLRIVSGFTAKEIALLFLSSEAAMAQRLSRSKRKLQVLEVGLLDTPTVFEIESRIGAVLKVTYLMFSLGYSPRSGSQLIRRDVAMEALRLVKELAAHTLAARPAVHALAALLCFQTSRFDARESSVGYPILLKDQNRELWDQNYIEAGLIYLNKAQAGSVLSRYHLEAGIASLYASAPSWEHINWPAILSLYERLEKFTNSPVIAISHCVATANSGQPQASLERLDELAQTTATERYAPYHIARAEVLRLLGRETEAQASFSAAIESGASDPVLQHIESRLGAII
ncbi:MAG: RNA polymerase sigma factor [Oceanococcus sp.]